jgi:hypothetical protein
MVHRSPSFAFRTRHGSGKSRQRSTAPKRKKAYRMDDPVRFEARKGICFVLQTAVAPALRRGSFTREATLASLPEPRMNPVFTQLR